MSALDEKLKRAVVERARYRKVRPARVEPSPALELADNAQLLDITSVPGDRSAHPDTAPRPDRGDQDYK